MSAAAALPPPSRKCPRCRDLVPILVDGLCLGCDSLIPDRETQVTEMVQNHGNTSAYVGGSEGLPVPHGDRRGYYEPHRPQARRPVEQRIAPPTMSVPDPDIAAARFEEPTPLPDAPAAPAWHADALQLLIDTEGHPDPAVNAARKVVANSLVALSKAHRTATVAARLPAVRQKPDPAPPVKRRWRRVPPDVAAEMVRRYQAGEPTDTIAQTLDVAASVVYRHLKQRGVQMRPKGGQPGNQNRRNADV